MNGVRSASSDHKTELPPNQIPPSFLSLVFNYPTQIAQGIVTPKATPLQVVWELSAEPLFSLAYQRHIAQQDFNTEFPLMWEWDNPQSFDVATSSTHTMPYWHALNLAWGKHCLS